MTSTHTFPDTQGSLQEFLVIGGPYGYRTQCPETQDEISPTGGQFKKMTQLVYSLQKDMEELRKEVSQFEF